MSYPAVAKYTLVFKLAAQNVFQYRFDFILHTLKYAMMVLMMALVWLAVGREAPLALSQNQTVTYFFLSAILYSLSNFHTIYIEDDIRVGGLTKYLVKPISPFLYYFVFEAAPATIETILKWVTMAPLLFLLGYPLQLTWWQCAWLAVFAPLIFSFAFAFLV